MQFIGKQLLRIKITEGCILEQVNNLNYLLCDIFYYYENDINYKLVTAIQD